MSATGFAHYTGDTNSVDTDAAFGDDATPGIIAVERAGNDRVRVYQRRGRAVSATDVPVEPWLVTTDHGLARLQQMTHTSTMLNGDQPLRWRVAFPTWSAFRDAAAALTDANEQRIVYHGAAEQHFIETGRGSFRGMDFADLVRLQLDIETLSLDPHAANAAIVLISLSINGESAMVLRADQAGGEAAMINELGRYINLVDPDVIEGHNLFRFDLPYIAARASALNVALRWGRDGSPLRFGREQRFGVMQRSMRYIGATIHGRHIIDTWMQLQRYDLGGDLESYALKPAIAALGLRRADRVDVDRTSIAELWEHERDTLIAYALDDARDVNSLSDLTLPTMFYQCQIVPRGLQAVAHGGTGERINDLMVRAYLRNGQSIPLPDAVRGYPGGYMELRRAGAFAPAVKCDVESLYPSIMLNERIAPLTDVLGLFLPMLARLKRDRLHAKRREQETNGIERQRWRGLQTSYKILINSFYGYLGYGRAWFSDFAAAERVTLRGQDIARDMVQHLEALNAVVVEVDTDGVMFQPPATSRNAEDEAALVAKVDSLLGEGYTLAYEGRFAGVVALKLKSYGMLHYDGHVTLKGSALRSRRDETLLRQFARDLVPRLLVPERYGTARDLYLDQAQRIAEGQFDPRDIGRWESITDRTHGRTGNQRLAAIASQADIGERLFLYQRAGGTLALVDEYANDHDVDYLLRRLHDMAERFRTVFEDDATFNWTFPVVNSRSTIAALRDQPLTRQASLFGA